MAAPSETRQNVGQGAGLRYMIERGLGADMALYHKPGYHVSWFDEGLSEFRVLVRGTPGYMANECDGYTTVTNTARLLLALDQWGEEYRRTASSGPFRARLAVNAARIGRPDKPNWSPAVAEVFADLRTPPWTGADEALALFETAMARIMHEYPAMDLAWERIAWLPGGQTDPANWIVQSAIRGALAVDGHQASTYTSRPAGQTEMGLLASAGVPTAKIFGGPGVPGNLPNPELPADLRQGFTMSGAYGPHIVKAAQVMVYVIVDTLTRTREEVGLS